MKTFMKSNHIWMSLLSGLFLTACSSSPVLTVTVENPLEQKRSSEIVEVKSVTLKNHFHTGNSEYLLKDDQNHEIPYQITHEGDLIFPVSLKAKEEQTFYISEGKPSKMTVSTCGKQYPERVDDIAWENDKIAFRTYGPALQRNKERAFGYDIWLKNTSDLVVEKRYATELNPETRSHIQKLRKEGEKERADSIAKAISYHIDHGNGMDCYKVGPTLGAGTAALMQKDSSIIYPYCYKDFEILDNGPLRFKVKLTYHPFELEGKNVVETRIIQLDQGSYLNRTEVSYKGLTDSHPLSVGIVIQPYHKDKYSFSKTEGYMSYIDPTDNPNNGNGLIYVGAVFPKQPNEIKPCFFTDEERKEHGNASGHIMGFTTYQPNSSYTYYWGAGWSKSDIKSEGQWISYLKDFSIQLKNPLIIKTK